MIDRAAIVDRAGAVGAAAAVIVALAVAPVGAAAANPCVASGMLAILPPTATVPQPVGPELTSADRQSAVTDAYSDATSGTGLTVTHVLIGVAGCVDAAGTPGGTSTRATAWSILGEAVGGSSLQVDLVPKAAPGTGWHLRPNLEGLLVERKAATLAEGATIALGDWGILDRPELVDAGPGVPLRWWKAALEVRLTRPHFGFAIGTRLLIGWVAADRAPAAPAPPVAAPPTTTAPTTTVPAPTTTTTTTTAPPATTSTTPKHAVKKTATKKQKAAKKHPKVHRKAHRRRRVSRVGLPLRVAPSLGQGSYDFPVLGTASWGDTYGALRSDVPGGWHHGDDLFVSLGTPVVAVADGTVFAVGWNEVGGWRLWLQDGQGNDFYYAHLSGYTKLAKDNHHVHRGQVLGFVGNTGDAFTTIPHLHFEVHPFGLLSLGYDGAVDPTRYLAGWPRAGSSTEVLPPVPLPSPNFRGSGSLTDFRRLLALRPLAKPRKVTPPGVGQQVLKKPKPEAALAAAGPTSNASGGWGPAAAGVLLLVLAAFAVWLTARAGRSD
jgi:murein DD-endopeptidase MepM/ murein hydrolase activator NlpD